MGLSKSQSILILLGVDAAFFLLEITVGYAVHSLALVADSFHMLNDVLSLLVGLWAVKVAQQRERTSMYTYGWQRAETVGALVNGVFLVALCLSIVLDAIQRFVEPQEVSSPKLVLIVGCCGLASNILGLALFHDHGHGHSHGGPSHSHGHTDPHGAAEEGHSHSHDHDHAHNQDNDTRRMADESGPLIDVLPEIRVSNGAPQPTGKQSNSKAKNSKENVNPSPRRIKSGRHNHNRSRSRTYSNLDEIYVHPASFRNEIIAAARGDHGEQSTDTESEENVHYEPPSEQTPLINKGKSNGTEGAQARKTSKGNSSSTDLHKDHKHRKPQKSSDSGHGHGHSHGDLNMRGVFLHVLGDALGNIGVILSALVIWLTDFWWRFYADPAISLIITIIILTTAIPLCKAASRILLQAVPYGISIDDLKADIEELPGIISAHHIHVWQLSDTKVVSSLHVQVEFDFKDEGSVRYMELARAIRKCLHEYGIHSSTIQPEFYIDVDTANGEGPEDSNGEDDNIKPSDGNGRISKKGSKASSLNGLGNACLLECGDECEDGQQCCAPAVSSSRAASDNGK